MFSYRLLLVAVFVDESLCFVNHTEPLIVTEHAGCAIRVLQNHLGARNQLFQPRFLRFAGRGKAGPFTLLLFPRLGPFLAFQLRGIGGRRIRGRLLEWVIRCSVFGGLGDGHLNGLYPLGWPLAKVHRALGVHPAINGGRFRYAHAQAQAQNRGPQDDRGVFCLHDRCPFPIGSLFYSIFGSVKAVPCEQAAAGAGRVPCYDPLLKISVRLPMSERPNMRQRGAFLLPNALTTLALFAGVYSIIAGINGAYISAAVAIGIAGILDGLDGRVARMTNTQSEFVVQYDSLSDMISFGLAPALLAFNWCLQGMADISPTAGKLGWLAAFVYIACAALRLARFNSQAGGDDKTYFQGLASPAAALSVAVCVWFFEDQNIAAESVRWFMWVLTIVLGLLMFSNVRYFSFKTIATNEKVPMFWLFLMMLALVLFAIDPPTVGLVIGSIYISSGFIMTLIGRRKRQARRALRRNLRRQAAARRAAEQEAPAAGEDKV